jgi:hypothetical protein
VNATYDVVGHLVEEGLLDLNPGVFTERVLAETSIDMPWRVYSAELGTELPADLADPDPEVWRPVHEDVELLADPEDGSPGCPNA